MDYLQAHKDKKIDRAKLNERRDNDRELITSYDYKMLDKDDREIPDLINVTMNRLKVFKAYVEASLHKADENVVVETEDGNKDVSKVEDAIRAGFRSANDRLTKRGEFELEPFIDEQSCMRGEGAARVLFQMMPAEEGKAEYLDTDITHWDTRFLTYERGFDGLAWVGYETKKSKSAIESEAWAKERNFTITGKTAPEIDIWTPEGNIIFVNGKQEYEQEHSYGVVPVCIQRVAIGTMMADEGNLEFQCESIFFLVRNLINEYNRCMSILQTLNFKAVKAALQQVLPDGAQASDYDEVARSGSVTATTTPHAIDVIPYGEARRSMILALQEINKALDDGTLSRITLGDLPGEMSAVALVQIEKGQGQVFMPRLGMRGLLKEQIAEMFISQIRELGVSTVEMGSPGHKETFKISDLEGEYKIDFRYSNKSPETDFARLSMAKQYKESDLLDELSIMTDVMKRDDPDGDQRKLFRQRLRGVSPNLQVYDGLMSLAEAYEDGDESAKDEIAIVEAELMVRLDQLLAGNLPQPAQATAKTEPLALTGQKSSAQKAADLIATPGEEEGGD